MVYYCGMETDRFETEKELAILADNRRYFYTIKPFELTNFLGHVITILDEYIFVSAELNGETELYTLHRTEDGNWYDITETNSVAKNAILRSLKSAIEKL